MSPRACVGLVEYQCAVLFRVDLAEPVDVGRQIAPAHPVLGRLYQKAVMAVLGPVVAVFLIGLAAPLFRHLRLGGIAADGVVPTGGVLDDGAEDPSHVGIEAMAGGQLEGVLTL